MAEREAVQREKAEKKLRRQREERQQEEEQEEKVQLPPAPVLYKWPATMKRLGRQETKPGHLVQRKWLQKGKDQGYVSVPFASAVKPMLADQSVNLCLIGRREASDAVSKQWQQELDDLPVFDVSGVAEVSDLDPMEPPWETPLDEELPTDDELRALAREPGMLEQMQKRFLRDPEELAYRTNKYRDAEEAKIFRTLVAGLPEELLQEDYTELVRRTNREMLKLLWSVHVSVGATKMRWRLACTDGDPSEEEQRDDAVVVRAYFILAGEGLDFVPSKFVDQNRISTMNLLSYEQVRRMDSEDWASSVAAADANTSEVLKRVPPGWTTYVKGDKYPGMKGKGATYRLRQTGKRLFMQVDFLEGQPKPAKAASAQQDGVEGDETSEDEAGGKEAPSTLLWLGPLAGVVAGFFAAARKSPPYVFGQEKRREIDQVLRALQRTPGRSSVDVDMEKSISKFEQRLWMDFGDADEAPVVLVVGGQSETGKVISRKLVSSGYHVVLLQLGKSGKGGARVERLMPQGAVLASAKVDRAVDLESPVCADNIPDTLYDAVVGIDKLVICNCDKETNPANRLDSQTVKDILACWQLYRRDFSDQQRAYSAKVRLFNFERDTDFELWDLERQRPSDLCYGRQRCGWTRNWADAGMFIGQFYEPVGQALLKSPRLKLNFKRFSGLLVNVYNQAVWNKYSWFLRTSDFEETRLQYEFDFECEASSWSTVRMPFNAFRPVRADGVPLPADENGHQPLRREDVVQMGVVVRTEGKPRPYGIDGRLNYFSLEINTIKVFRRQAEPQVIYLGRQEDMPSVRKSGEAGGAEEAPEEEDMFEDMVFTGDDLLDESFMRAQQAEEEAAAEIAELVSEQPLPEPRAAEDTEDMEFDAGKPKTPVSAVIESGLAYTIINVNRINSNPGGRYPVSIHQASVSDPPLSNSFANMGTLSRGDAAELVISSLVEPMCVNAEMGAGESPRGGQPVEGKEPPEPTLEITSTMQEDVKAYMKQLTPNL